METVLIFGIVAFIAYIAGRAQVGTKVVTIEHAETVAAEMYAKGHVQGRTEAVKALQIDKDLETSSVNEIALLDEYISGFSFAMRAVRDHGALAEAATKDHIAEMLRKREQAVIRNPGYRGVVRL